MNKLKWNHFKYPFCIIGGILLGFLFCNYTFFEFDEKINLIELFNVLITAIVALFLTMYIQDKQSKTQKEKEFVINEINELHCFVKEIKGCSRKNIYPFEDIKSTFKDFNVQHKFISDIISVNGQSEIQTISVLLRSLRRTITTESPIDGNITLNSVSKRNTVDKKLYELKLSIFNLLKVVNNNHK
ncbi:hypothetical protein [Sphingobacterium sp. UDSM-2020]|uniref:hypothetical protein n=1 Tax=Sphingobacterium sp. UDSM-2020 TaxID=2795738 RepID=UPI001937D575|nr:hypothetical protein [Sphingobacterium sp. UDSM-2020]QQD14269.1 hypothetical protein JAZ75_01600 [Sphingobacterium sp. UDSM-2020]